MAAPAPLDSTQAMRSPLTLGRIPPSTSPALSVPSSRIRRTAARTAKAAGRPRKSSTTAWCWDERLAAMEATRGSESNAREGAGVDGSDGLDSVSKPKDSSRRRVRRLKEAGSGAHRPSCWPAVSVPGSSGCCWPSPPLTWRLTSNSVYPQAVASTSTCLPQGRRSAVTLAARGHSGSSTASRAVPVAAAEELEAGERVRVKRGGPRGPGLGRGWESGSEAPPQRRRGRRGGGNAGPASATSGTGPAWEGGG